MKSKMGKVLFLPKEYPPKEGWMRWNKLSKKIQKEKEWLPAIRPATVRFLPTSSVSGLFTVRTGKHLNK